MDNYQKFIAASRYARWQDDEGRRETWEETVDRYIDFFVFRDQLDATTAAELREAIVNLDVMPSMRAMMTAGKALERDNVAGFNCSYLPIDHPRAFDELMYILMCGTGVGFSVERQYINKLPEVAEAMYPTETVIKVADSKIGWAKAMRELVSLLYSGQVPSWDTTGVRGSGERLKTFGGRASGPEPLEGLFMFTVELFKKAQGRKLSSLECHDLCCKIAEVIVVGGVRRSALISLSNPSDGRLRSAKSGQWWLDNGQRALANNSACYTAKPEFDFFLAEMASMYESRSGERGIFSRKAAQAVAAKNGRRDATADFGTNPCCFTGDMELRVLSSFGVTTMPLKNLATKETVKVVNHNGDITEGSVWSSGVKDIVAVNFNNKDPIRCTGDHVFMLNDGSECQAKDLKGKRPMPYVEVIEPDFTETFLAGFMLGDANLSRMNSTKHRGVEVYFSDKDMEIAEAYGAELKGNTWYSRYAKQVALNHDLPSDVIGERELPDGIAESCTGLAGLYSANGCVIKGNRVALKTIDPIQAKLLKESLGFEGITAYITVNKPRTITFKNGDYLCKESYDVNISRYDSLVKFAKKISFGQSYKREALKELLIAKAPCVKSVVDAGREEVFDFTEPKTHWGIVEGCVVHNSEIILRPNQFCNLSEVVVRPEDTTSDLVHKVRLASILGTLQATLTDFRYLRKIWKDNTEEEALLGVSLTGIMDNELTRTSTDALEKLLSTLKDEAINTNKVWAKKLGINQSAAITCVKPSGTVSQLVNSASGIHPRFSSYYIRTVRCDKKDPMAKYMQEAGFPCETDLTKESNLVFSFPVKAPKGATVVKDVTALEQLKLWKTYQDHWCEHKPSVTIYYTDDEFFDVCSWVWKNFDSMSGVSFLPHSDHVYQQAPYQEITKEQYEEALKAMPSFDWEALASYESTDMTTGSQELACVGTSCEL